MLLHHLALGAQCLETVAAFYVEFFAVVEVDRHQDELGLRSIWLRTGDTVIMVERTQDPTAHAKPQTLEVEAGPFLLVFGVTEDERSILEERLTQAGHPIEAQTKFTSYTRDPEGNRVGFSTYDLP